MILEMFNTGDRVIREPSWQRGNEDGGEGLLGTVVCAGWQRFFVKWDIGYADVYSIDDVVLAPANSH